jgi:energy-coupling factor transporter transmembrane protein EcfT
MTDDIKKYGTLIARLMAETITDEEAMELDEWVAADERNMRLFEDLTNDFKMKWAKQWFASRGISVRGIKWKKMDGWYKEERKNLRDFYLLAAVVILAMVLMYLALKFL